MGYHGGPWEPVNFAQHLSLALGAIENIIPCRPCVPWLKILRSFALETTH
jgi:hypothetical protein